MIINYLHLYKATCAVIVTPFLLMPAYATDTGSSHNLFILERLDKRSFFVGRANLATRDGFSDPFFGYADANYRYSVSGPWAIEAGYRHAVLELGNRRRQEYRPMLALYWRGTLGTGSFSNRNRIEFRYFEGYAKDRLRYRNESAWTSLNKITAYALTPFIEEEFFYDITDDTLNINWLTFGISKRWMDNAKWKLGYRLQSQKLNGEWEHRHVLVTGLSFISFD